MPEKWWDAPRIKTLRGLSILGPIQPIVGPSHISQYPSEQHMAVDYGAALGAPVVAPIAGKVTRIQRTPETGYGLAVFLKDPKTGLEWTFAHLGNIAVKIGQVLKPGEQLGTVGSTGTSSGPHLHLEIGTAGAQPFYGKASEAGAVDPRPFLEGAVIGSMAGLIPGTVAGPTSGIFDSGLFKSSNGNGSKPSGVSSAPPTAKKTTEPDKKEPAGVFSPFEGVADRAGEAVKRAGFITAGLLIVLLGLILMAFSYREQIGGAAKGAGKTAAKAGTIVAAPEAAPVVAAVVK